MTILINLAGSDRTVEDYEGWLKSLRHGDKVVFQQFSPYDDSSTAFGASFEYWYFALVSYCGETISAPRIDQPIRGNGVACWHGSDGSDAEWPGGVLPARIVPYGHWKEMKNVGDCAISLNPVYEPLYTNKTRSVFLVPYGESIHTGILEFNRQGLRYYYRKVDEGYLVTVFSDEIPTMEGGAAFRYSEYVRG